MKVGGVRSQIRWPPARRNAIANKPDFSVKLDHFKLLRVVGKGAFGKVRIVERRDTGLTFALKYIRKDEGGLPFPFTAQPSETDFGGQLFELKTCATLCESGACWST